MNASIRVEPDLPELDKQRALIHELDAQFASLHLSSRELVSSVSAETFDGRRGRQQRPVDSVRENVLRSAGVIEQTFGGITANLWDDPFEWTLPETLNTRQRIVEYLEEVEATRRRAFTGMAKDSELLQDVVVPSGERRTLISLLNETISRATSYQDRAFELRDLLAVESKVSHPGESL
ncbi:MAG: hypothetical protein ABI596_04465 [Pyrinomonadaceae bacterium]